MKGEEEKKRILSIEDIVGIAPTRLTIMPTSL